MKILAVVPARSGSKRLPGKNIRLLGGKPLIVWSIEVVYGIPGICDTLVSTDDPAIAEIARAAGVLVPWLRPADLATDITSSVAVCLHALDWYEAEKGTIDGLLLLQPTSPYRSQETVRKGIELFYRHNNRPVIGVSPAESHPMRCFQIEGDTMRPFIKGSGLMLRSQDLPLAYAVNGAFYLIAPDDLRKRQSFYTDNIMPLPIDSAAEAIDIDTEWDWKMAETILSGFQSCSLSSSRFG
ncbi:acylneuraminate cytidylyltransferase family protein [Synechococcales cyanobacterium C]|uniref:Acylneuraminate cytidylyltransferase family protein n=1 Tax=Petrachloros mirabilis ULC683 TaxID=2781853 RepID=A0A8K2A8G2_9CYAN|nr:acylneuraminate cytidylyltransferase family protein [Petrachloros mirabilis]NCJ07075.1 acylneuraminate cytidylyltransferase family protein [Petrachloros mirabilis ULC683]